MKRLFPLALVLGLALTAAGCGDDEKSPCETACSKSTKAGCVNDDPENVCVASCKAIYDAAVCRDENRALVKCIAKSTFSCDVDGYSMYAGCDAEFDAFASCND